MLGLVDVYNLLPQYVVDATNISEFQKRSQTLVMEMAEANEPDWLHIFSPRKTLWNNKLRKLHEWCPTNANKSKSGVEEVLPGASSWVATNAIPGWLQ